MSPKVCPPMVLALVCGVPWVQLLSSGTTIDGKELPTER